MVLFCLGAIPEFGRPQESGSAESDLVEIEFKNGRIVRGEIVRETDSRITIRSESGSTFTMPSAQVVEIRRSTTGAGLIEGARVAIDAGRFSDAYRLLEEIDQVSADEDELGQIGELRERLAGEASELQSVLFPEVDRLVDLNRYHDALRILRRAGEEFPSDSRFLKRVIEVEMIARAGERNFPLYFNPPELTRLRELEPDSALLARLEARRARAKEIHEAELARQITIEGSSDDASDAVAPEDNPNPTPKATPLRPLSERNRSMGRGVSVVSQKFRNGADLWVNNGEYHDVTLKVVLSGTNVATSERSPFTGSFPARSRTRVIKLRAKSLKSGWRFQHQVHWTPGNINAKHNDEVIYMLPYPPGYSAPVSQGYNGEATHKGDSAYAIDFAMPIGSRVSAAREGMVVHVTDSSTEGGASFEFLEKANRVIIQHDDGTLASYAHLSPRGGLVEPGQYVEAGQLIGVSGNTGFSSGPHLHFMVFKPINVHKRESIPTRFDTKRGVVEELKRGQTYVSK